MFILIMQFFWVYIDDLIGKGLSILVILELLFYVSASLIPLALPLAILLSSLMTFGNLSEKNELTALKSSGLSLYRIMRPLTMVVILLAGFTFYFSNYIIPLANLKWHSLIYDIQNTKLSTIITPGVYTRELEGYAIKVKEGNDSLFKDIIIHDHSIPTEFKTVKAKEARLYRSKNGLYLFFNLKNGVVYEELESQSPIFLSNGEEQKGTISSHPSRITNFEKASYKMNISGFKLNRTDEDVFTNKYEMLNVFQINAATDSLQIKQKKIKKSFAEGAMNNSAYFLKINSSENLTIKKMDLEKKATVKNWGEIDKNEKIIALNDAIAKLRRLNQNISSQKDFIKTISKEEDQYWIEFHRKFALTYAIIVLFFIGAPLGAIIRKGGFGAPVVIAAVIFMIYFIIISIGDNLADTAVVSPFFGMWMAGIFFTPIALFITKAAADDSSIFSREFWGKLIKKKKRNAGSIH
jgi:lipopolysaccharide export system permease protein